MSNVLAWLWEARRFSGVTDDRDTAMEHAEAHLSADGTVLVELAAVTSGIGGTRHIRTGCRRIVCLVCGHVQWAEGNEAEAS